MATICTYENCTFVETGSCLLNNDPESCPHRDENDKTDAPLPELDPVAISEEPKGKIAIPDSFALTLNQVEDLMTRRYVHLVGILGEPNAGKTAVLLSLYLLLSRNLLKGYSYADSGTLMALDEISQGARIWNEGRLPDQVTTHTKGIDERTAGFIHLRVKSNDSAKRFDITLPDLPGEWTTSLIEKNRRDRLTFLRRADALWIMVNGEELSQPSSRQVVIHRVTLLIQRIAEIIHRETTLILVISRKDRATPDTGAIEAICDEANRRHMDLKVAVIASVSEKESITPGAGVSDLIDLTLRSLRNTPSFWPLDEHHQPEARMLLAYRYKR